jgi:hypothetical protein
MAPIVIEKVECHSKWKDKMKKIMDSCLHKTKINNWHEDTEYLNLEAFHLVNLQH